MRHDRFKIPTDSFHANRKGFLYFGTLREILVVSLATAIVIASLDQVGLILNLHSSRNESCALKSDASPIESLHLDYDHNSLVVHSWRSDFSEINLETRVSTKKQSPIGMVSASASEHNSTTIMLSQTTDSTPIQQVIYIVRRNELILSKEIPWETCVSLKVRVSADGRVAIAFGKNGVVFGWEMSSDNPVQWQFQLNHSIVSECLSPDGRWIFASDGDRDTAIYDARKGRRLIELSIIDKWCRTAVWSRDSQRLALSDGDGELYVFDAASGTKVWHHKLDFLYACSLGLSNDGNHLAVAGFDKQIRVWDLSDPTKSPKVLIGESRVIHDLVFTNGDKSLISGNDSGEIREWSPATCKMIRQLR